MTHITGKGNPLAPPNVTFSAIRDAAAMANGEEAAEDPARLDVAPLASTARRAATAGDGAERAPALEVGVPPTTSGERGNSAMSDVDAGREEVKEEAEEEEEGEEEFCAERGFFEDRWAGSELAAFDALSDSLETSFAGVESLSILSSDLGVSLFVVVSTGFFFVVVVFVVVVVTARAVPSFVIPAVFTAPGLARTGRKNVLLIRHVSFSTPPAWALSAGRRMSTIFSGETK